MFLLRMQFMVFLFTQDGLIKTLVANSSKYLSKLTSISEVQDQLLCWHRGPTSYLPLGDRDQSLLHTTI